MTDSNYLRLTSRQCERLRSLFEKAAYEGSNFEWEKIKAVLDNGAKSRSGTRIDLSFFPAGVAEHLLTLLKRLEIRTCHKQAGDALRERINTLNDFLGVSAVDRLGELM